MKYVFIINPAAGTGDKEEELKVAIAKLPERMTVISILPNPQAMQLYL